MDEFIREVDEEHRREQVLQIWRRFGGLIVGLAFVVIAGIGGWRYWQYAEVKQAEVAATRFADATDLAGQGNSEEAEKALLALASDAPAGYRMLARFRAAAETGLQAPEAGAKAFDTLAGDGALGADLQGLARLRAAALRLDGDDPKAGATALESLAAPASPWRHSARELLGLSALKRGDYDGAGRWFEQIATDRETPQGLRGRLEIYSALVAGGPVQPTQ